MKTLNIALLNVCSLGTGFDELCSSIEVYKIDILALNETWCTKNESLDYLTIPNFSLFQQPRSTRGGGVGFYVRNSIKVKQVMTANSVTEIEHMWLKMTINKQSVIMGTAYKPPNQPYGFFLNHLSSIVSELIATVDHFYILGDFNINLQEINPNSRLLLQFFQSYNLSQAVSESTRITASSESLIDVVCTNHPASIQSVAVIGNDISDHCLILVALKLEIPVLPDRIVFCRRYKDIDLNGFGLDLCASLIV